MAPLKSALSNLDHEEMHELARRANVAPSTLYRLRQPGRQSCNLSSLDAIVRALGGQVLVQV